MPSPALLCSALLCSAQPTDHTLPSSLLPIPIPIPPLTHTHTRAHPHPGADFFYRLNDDTELQQHWPQAFTSALLALPPPHGVVGPTCLQGNAKILTHDFVARVHMEVR